VNADHHTQVGRGEEQARRRSEEALRAAVDELLTLDLGNVPHEQAGLYSWPPQT
jgi:hypothetical protein